MSPEGWSEFCRRLRHSIGALRVRRSPWGPVFALAGGAVIAVAVWLAVQFASNARDSLPPAATTPGASDAGSHRSVGA